MKRKYLLLIGILTVCCVLGGCKKKTDAAKVSASSEEPTIITKSDSVSGQVVEMQQGSNIDKSQITNVMGTQTATSGDLVITNLTGEDISAFYARASEEEDWGMDYVEGKFTLKNNDRALFYYDKEAKSSSGAAITKYDLRVSFADESLDDCYFRELTLSDIEELSLNLEDGVPYVKYRSLSTKQQVSTLSAARKRMGLPDSDSSENTEGSSSAQTTSGRRTSSGTNTNTSTGTGTGTGTDNTSSDPSSAQQPVDSGSNTGSDPTPADTDPSGGDPGDSNEGGGDVVPPGLEGQGQDMRDTAQNYVGQDMDSLIGDIGTANATEYGTDEATGDTIVYHYYDGFAVSTVEGEDGGQTVTGIW